MISSQSKRASVELGSRLLTWYDRKKRDLPWRADQDPYRVWISEIMLQQTRVAAVLEHYQQFLRRFPTVESLAAAPESAVLTAWSGLGYYRRARFLHRAARAIMQERAGKFPATAHEWRKLPGIGRYTAAAIASIAFREPVAVVDGNVERVLERLTGRQLPALETWGKAQELICRERPGDFNQALMELGAMVCLPGQPKCSECPVAQLCATRGRLAKPGSQSRHRKATLHYALRCKDSTVFLVQRPKAASLMPGMWELPQIPAHHPHRQAATGAMKLRHSITVTDYEVRVSRVNGTAPSVGKWVKTSRLNRIPLTGLARKILRAAQII